MSLGSGARLRKNAKEPALSAVEGAGNLAISNTMKMEDGRPRPSI